ncbi:MAG: NDP-sugar synthase, partial [Nitrospinaceae bacterium]|nr:NDP-sugar synthase [Nitrospinaceae bacterium]
MNMRAFVLAAGLGIRMGPLGEEIPKALLPLGGVSMVKFALSRLAGVGVSEAVVNIHHRADAIREHLGDSFQGIALHYSHEVEILGTAGGLKKAEEFLREGGGPFFVLNADIVSNADLEAAMRHHQSGRFLATLILRETKEVEKFGALAVDAAGRLRKFLGASAPGEAAGNLTEAMFTGQSVLSPEFLDNIPAGRSCGISEEVYPPLMESGALIGGCLTTAYWADVGTPARYLEAVFDLLAGRFMPALEWPEGDNTLIEGAPLEWGGGMIHPPVLIGKGVRLERGATAGPFAVLGSGATLEEDATVS